MSRKKVSEIKPFASILIIIISLFSVVFFKMEVVRMGYIVLKQSRELKKVQDKKRQQDIIYAQVLRPERVRQIAVSQLTLNDARSEQIIQMTGNDIAIRQ